MIVRYRNLLSIVLLLFISSSSIVQSYWWDNLFRDVSIESRIDVDQDNDNIIVTMNVPDDIDPDNIVIDIKDRRLHVYGKAEKKEEVRDEGFYKKEVRSSSFNRSVTLPCMVDDLATQAELHGEKLIITMPKIKELDSSSKKIKVIRI